jgi:hypothetical protein
MIRRRQGDEFLLIAQTAHAHLAAEVAARVGNDRFATPLPRREVLTGIDLHDAGWADADTKPIINSGGEPCDVFEMPHERALAIWSLSTQTAMAVDPYAGLLVSLHGMELSSHIKAEKTERAMSFALLKFQHNQIEIQEKLRAALNMRTDQPLRRGLSRPRLSAAEDALLFNFRILEMADQLSLNFCFDEHRIPVIHGIHPRPGAESMTLIVRRTGAGNFSIVPWPFDSARLEFNVPAKRLAARAYRDDDDLRHAYAAAANEVVRITLSK